jgi:hypothetical protein
MFKKKYLPQFVMKYSYVGYKNIESLCTFSPYPMSDEIPKTHFAKHYPVSLLCTQCPDPEVPFLLSSL